jgi:hypothetical protein
VLYSLRNIMVLSSALFFGIAAAAQGTQLAALTNPAPGSTLTGSSAAFSWTMGTGVTAYWLYLGATVGASNLYSSGSLSGTSVTVNNLPTNGLTLYATLFSQVGGAWKPVSYTYTESGSYTLAALSSPSPGSVLSGSSALFSWTSGTGPTAYWLYLGTTAGASNLYNSGSLSGTSVTVNNLPANGVILYATLFSQINGAWKPVSNTYTEAGSYTLAALSSPSPGSVLAGSSASFSWTSGAGPTAYWLYLGTTAGASNLYNSGSLSGTSVAVNNLPTNGVILYATLFSQIDGAWKPVGYTYTEAGSYTLAAMTRPSQGSALFNSTATFTWTSGVGPAAYWLFLGTTAGASNLYSSGSLSGTSVTVNNLPTNSATVYATLFSNIDGGWKPVSYTYTEASPPAQATITAPTPSSVLPGSSQTFSWTAGSQVSAYWLYVGTTGTGSSNFYNSGSISGTSMAVSGLPTNGVTLYATLFSQINGAWKPASFTYTEAGSYTLAALTTPSPGGVLPGSSVPFSWTAGTGPTAYWLYLGTTVGASNLYTSGSLSGTSVTVNNVPTNGAAIYATLFSNIDGGWKPVSYTYTAAPSIQQFLALSSSGTYLVNPSTGKPVYLLGDTGWAAAVSISDADADTYLSARAGQGFNLVWMAAANSPTDFYGDPPFDGSVFTDEDSNYWAHIDWIVQDAESYGITLAIAPAFVGLDSSDGYITNIADSSCSTLTSYGTFLGARYKGYPNIVWATGGDADYNLVAYSQLNCLDQGIVGADPNHLITMETCPQASCGVGNTSTSEDWTQANVGSTPVSMNLNWVYNQYQSIQGGCAANYAAAQTAGPSFIGETWYENEHSLTPLQVREEGYWGVLSGCTIGYTFGNNPIWCFNAVSGCVDSFTWQNELSSNGSLTQQWMGILMRSREFWKMVPDSTNTVLTGGIGSGTSISVAGCSSDGETCIVYDPVGNTQAPQIAMAHFSGTVQAWWFNPPTGATTNLATFSNSGTHTFTPPDGNDWVLVLDLASAALPAPGVGSFQ